MTEQKKGSPNTRDQIQESTSTQPRPLGTEPTQRSSSDMARRDFLRLGVQATALLPLAGMLPACSSPDPNKEPKTRPKDSQDDVKPGDIDKAKQVALDPPSIKKEIALFPLGIQAGAMTDSKVTLWGYTTDEKPKKLRLWRESTEKGKIALAQEKELTPKDGYFKEDIEGLAPGTWYNYAFFQENEKRSEIGRFKTALHKDSQKPITIAATACTKFNFMPYTSLETTATKDYDIFLHLGDFSYNDGSKNTADYRAKWHQTLKDKGYQAALPKAGQYVTWDDHELANDSEIDNLTPEQRKAGVDAFFEHTVTKRIDGDRFWTSYRWGKTAEIIVLDCRSERIHESRETKDATYIGKEQMAFLKKTLKETPCHFKIIMNSVPITDWDKTLLGKAAVADRWQGYPAQRKDILSFIEDNKIGNVWWLSGDMHIGSVGKIDPEGPHAKMYEILVGPGAQVNPITFLYEAASKEDKEKYFPAKQFDYFSGDFAATLLTFDPWKNTVHVRFIHHETRKTLFEKTLKYGT